MRDDVYGASILFAWRLRRFQHGRAQARIGSLFSCEGKVDDSEIRSFTRQLEGFAARSRRAGKEDGARIGERILCERLDYGGFVAQACERALLIFVFGD